MIIIGNLDFEGCKNLTSLGNLKEVKGYLDLSETKKIFNIPDNLIVGKNLSLRDSKITSLPKNLKVKGWVDLRFTEIFELPKNIKIGGILWLHNSKITEEYIKKFFPKLFLKCTWIR